MKTGKWRDSYTAKAQKEGFPARSVYKLQEIQKGYGILKKGGRILDLGCVPGSWLLYASEIVGPKGFVLGIDQHPLSLKLPSNAGFRQMDILESDHRLTDDLEGPFDVVLSDMAPSTTGNKVVDGQRSLDLCRSALSIASHVLRPGGALVCKLFHSPDFNAFSSEVKAAFHRVAHLRPKSTRKASKEIFIIGLGKKAQKRGVEA